MGLHYDNISCNLASFPRSGKALRDIFLTLWIGKVVVRKCCVVLLCRSGEAPHNISPSFPPSPPLSAPSSFILKLFRLESSSYLVVKVRSLDDKFCTLRGYFLPWKVFLFSDFLKTKQYLTDRAPLEDLLIWTASQPRESLYFDAGEGIIFLTEHFVSLQSLLWLPVLWVFLALRKAASALGERLSVLVVFLQKRLTF